MRISYYKFVNVPPVNVKLCALPAISCTFSVDNCVLFVVILPPNETEVPSIVMALSASLLIAIAASDATLLSDTPEILATGIVPDVNNAAL